MSIEVKVPQLPESVADATLIAWHKSPGDKISRDENLADLETDKVVLEVPAPAHGVLKEIRIADGTTVNAGDVLAVLEEEGEAPGKSEAQPDQAKEKAEEGKDTVRGSAQDGTGEGEDDEPGKASGRLSPAVRRLVDEHELDVAEIRGSGRDGRITKGDVVAYLDQRDAGRREGAGAGDGQSRRESPPESPPETPP